MALWQAATSRAPQPSKTFVALGVLLAVIVTAFFGLVPLEVAASGGAVLMVLTGVISPRSAACAPEPRVLGLLAGSIGLGAIVFESGLADVIADAISDLSTATFTLVIVLALATTVMTNLVTNAATASIITPVALRIATDKGVDPVTVLALIGTCVSFTLINPFSHASNVMVMQPGGYTGAQFARFGAPILAACLVTVCGVAYLLLNSSSNSPAPESSPPCVRSRSLHDHPGADGTRTSVSCGRAGSRGCRDTGILGGALSTAFRHTPDTEGPIFEGARAAPGLDRAAGAGADLDAAGLTGAHNWTPARSWFASRRTIGGVGALATVGVWWLGATSSVLRHPVRTASFWAILVVAYLAVGLYTWSRRRDSRLGPLITGVAFVYVPVALSGSGNAVLHTLGLVAWSVSVVYSAYVYLCFPDGSLRSVGERRLMLGLGALTALLWVLILPLASRPPGGGALIACAASCPANGLQIAGSAEIGAALGTALHVLFAVALIVVAMLIAHHAWSAPPLRRRTLMPLALLALSSIAVFVISLLLLAAEPSTAEPLRVVSASLRIAIPVTLLVGQFRGDMFAARSLGRLAIDVNGQQLTPAGVEAILSDALGDPGLTVALWSEERGCYVDVRGSELSLPDEGPRPNVTRLAQGGTRIAALIHDPDLDIDPDLIDGLVAASLVMLQNARLVQELRASRSRIVATAQHERLRLERNLHDGAQQRLMAIQVRLRMAQRHANGSELADELAAIEGDAADAVEDLRALAHGIYPGVLRDLGLAPALRSIAITGPIPIKVRDLGIGRCPGAVEQAIYFCALEAMQNASKHAGTTARVVIELSRGAHEVGVQITDDGVGMDLHQTGDGIGLISMRDRIGSVGGEIEIRSSPGNGTVIRATVPDSNTASDHSQTTL